MKIKEVVERLTELAKGHYFSYSIEADYFPSTKTLEYTCFLYISKNNKGCSGEGATWKEAFLELERNLGLPLDQEEEPEIEL